MNETIRILMADDHLVVRKGLRLMLEEAGKGFELVGEASDGIEAVKLAIAEQPDVILMDLRMPGMDGIEAIVRIREQCPQIAIVILTVYNEDHLMVRGLRAGARGYLLKDTTRDTLFNAIRAAARGEMLIQPEIMNRILTHAGSHSNANSARDDADLTDREHEILAAIAQGERSKEIAQRLGITIRTVGAHLTSIYAKLGVDSRTSAVAVAIERGILPHSQGL